MAKKHAVHPERAHTDVKTRPWYKSKLAIAGGAVIVLAAVLVTIFVILPAASVPVTAALECDLDYNLDTDSVYLQDKCTVMETSSRRQLVKATQAKAAQAKQTMARLRSLKELRFVSDMYRAQDVTSEVWDEEFAAYWFHEWQAINANQMPQDRWESDYKNQCDKAKRKQACPLFYEVDTDDDGFIDDILNGTDYSLLTLLANKIYDTDPNAWKVLWEDNHWPGGNPNGNGPFDCQPIIDECKLDACVKADGSAKAYDKEDETHRMMCNVKSAIDGSRFMDPTAVVMVRGLMAVELDDSPCPEGQYRVLDQSIYSGLYIQLLAHLYNKFILGNDQALTVKIRYRPRKLSQTGGIHDLPCIDLTEQQQQ